MRSFNVKDAALVALVAVCASCSTGCYADAGAEPAGAYDAPPQDEPVAAYGYQQQYYNGYIVYYDDWGRPYTYSDGVASWVPVASPYYAGYVSHWRTYGHAYRRWYSRYGVHYRHYRARFRHWR